jgi:hypothetical protein
MLFSKHGIQRPWWFILMLVLPGCILDQFIPVEHEMPEIVFFEGEQHVCMSHKACATFRWEIQGAQSVQLEPGFFEEGVYYPGGTDVIGDLPASGSIEIVMSIHHYAGRLCLVTPETTTPICATCNPFEPDTCKQEGE